MTKHDAALLGLESLLEFLQNLLIHLEEQLAPPPPPPTWMDRLRRVVTGRSLAQTYRRTACRVIRYRVRRMTAGLRERVLADLEANAEALSKPFVPGEGAVGPCPADPETRDTDASETDGSKRNACRAEAAGPLCPRTAPEPHGEPAILSSADQAVEAQSEPAECGRPDRVVAGSDGPSPARDATQARLGLSGPGIAYDPARGEACPREPDRMAARVSAAARDALLWRDTPYGLPARAGRSWRTSPSSRAAVAFFPVTPSLKSRRVRSLEARGPDNPPDLLLGTVRTCWTDHAHIVTKSH